MKIYLMVLGCDVWKSIENGYTSSYTPPTDIVVNVILGGLANPMFVKVMHCKSTKEIWDKLKIIYEGYGKVKKSKLQTHRGKFESFKMKEE
jgi:hypothetical protein